MPAQAVLPTYHSLIYDIRVKGSGLLAATKPARFYLTAQGEPPFRRATHPSITLTIAPFEHGHKGEVLKHFFCGAAIGLFGEAQHALHMSLAYGNDHFTTGL